MLSQGTNLKTHISRSIPMFSKNNQPLLSHHQVFSALFSVFPLKYLKSRNRRLNSKLLHYPGLPLSPHSPILPWSPFQNLPGSSKPCLSHFTQAPDSSSFSIVTSLSPTYCSNTDLDYFQNSALSTNLCQLTCLPCCLISPPI